MLSLFRGNWGNEGKSIFKIQAFGLLNPAAEYMPPKCQQNWKKLPCFGGKLEGEHFKNPGTLLFITPPPYSVHVYVSLLLCKLLNWLVRMKLSIQVPMGTLTVPAKMCGNTAACLSKWLPTGEEEVLGRMMKSRSFWTSCTKWDKPQGTYTACILRSCPSSTRG